MSGVNDFAFKMATVNGTGSASANSLLMQAIFRMGVPVTGKNLFPSNIQGLPTFYEIRVSKDGYTARPSEVDLVVATDGVEVLGAPGVSGRAVVGLHDASQQTPRRVVPRTVPRKMPRCFGKRAWTSTWWLTPPRKPCDRPREKVCSRSSRPGRGRANGCFAAAASRAAR